MDKKGYILHSGGVLLTELFHLVLQKIFYKYFGQDRRIPITYTLNASSSIAAHVTLDLRRLPCSDQQLFSLSPVAGDAGLRRTDIWPVRWTKPEVTEVGGRILDILSC